jgi:hypothetical protein
MIGGEPRITMNYIADELATATEEIEEFALTRRTGFC